MKTTVVGDPHAGGQAAAATGIVEFVLCGGRVVGDSVGSYVRFFIYGIERIRPILLC